MGYPVRQETVRAPLAHPGLSGTRRASFQGVAHHRVRGALFVPSPICRRTFSAGSGRATTRGRRSSVERLRIALKREIAQPPGVAILSVQEYAQACRHVGVDSLPFHDLSIQFAKKFRLQPQVGANPFPVAPTVMRWRFSKPRPRAQVRENPPEYVRLVRLIFGQTFEPCLAIRIAAQLRVTLESLRET